MKVTIRTMLLTTMAGAAALATAAAAHALDVMSSDADASGAFAVEFSDVVVRNTIPQYTLRYSLSAEFMCATASPEPLTLPQYARTTSSSGTAQLDVPADVNGALQGRISSDIPQAPTNLHCPAGYSARVRVVHYTNVRLSRTGGDVPNTQTSVPGASREYFLPR